ncbi:MAG: PorP/SprF family type IX secretion system membrane protein [Bacteroidota bacterium]|nr:PorP/SprF family type IX secretion system membrane protein [Bacteroidota bacterium]
MKIRLAILILMIPALLSAQQSGFFGHAFQKPMALNPAYTGFENYTSAFLVTRIQWTDFKNAPRLAVFTLDGPLKNKKMGIGLGLISERKGISTKTGGHLNYSHKLLLGESSSLSFGVSAGIIDHTLNFSTAVLEDGSDPFVSGGAQRETSIDGNAGLLFKWKDLEVGAAVPQLFGDAVDIQDNETGNSNYALSRHFVGTLFYRIMISKEKELYLSPRAIVSFHPNAPLQYDAQLHLEWNDRIWLGATYKSNYAVAANAGVCINKQLSFGYSYDFVMGNNSGYYGMSHEIMLQFRFGKGSEKETDGSEATSLATNEKVDSLSAELDLKQSKIAANEEKIKELQEKLKQANAKKKEQVINANKNENSVAIAGNTAKERNNGVWIATGKAADFKDEKNLPAKKGYYVIVGTFVNRDFAEAEVQRHRREGFKSAKMVFFEGKQYYYVYVARMSTKEEATQKSLEAKAGGIQDVWIQLMID